MRLALICAPNFLRYWFSWQAKVSCLFRKKGTIRIQQYFFSKRSPFPRRPRPWPYSDPDYSRQQWALMIQRSYPTRAWYWALYQLWEGRKCCYTAIYSALRAGLSPVFLSCSAKVLVSSTNLSKLNPLYFFNQASTFVLPKTLPSRRMMVRKKASSLVIISTSRRDQGGSISAMMRRSDVNVWQSLAARSSSILTPAASSSSCRVLTSSSKTSSASAMRSYSLIISLLRWTTALVLSVLLVDCWTSCTVEAASSLCSSMIGWLQTCLVALFLRMLSSSRLYSASRASSISQYSLMVTRISAMLILYSSLHRLISYSLARSFSSLWASLSQSSVLAFREQYFSTSFQQSSKQSHFSRSERYFLLKIQTISRYCLFNPSQATNFSLKISNLFLATLCDLVPRATLLLLSWLLMVRWSRLTPLTKLSMTSPCVLPAFPASMRRSASSVAVRTRLQRRWQMECIPVTISFRYSMQLNSFPLFQSIRRQYPRCSVRIYGIRNQFIIVQMVILGSVVQGVGIGEGSSGDDKQWYMPDDRWMIDGDHIFSMMVLSSRQLLSPSSPFSLPMPESLNPPNGVIEAKTLQQLTQTVPALSFLTRQLASEWLSVTTPAPKPQQVSLARLMTSSRSSNLKMLLTGPKISSLAMVWLSCTSAKTVGSTYHPLLPQRLPPATNLAPSFFPCSMKPRTRVICSSLTNGPCSVSGESECPSLIF